MEARVAAYVLRNLQHALGPCLETRIVSRIWRCRLRNCCACSPLHYGYYIGVLELHAQDSTTTMMKVEGEFTVTGPLETFVNAGGVHVARALLSDFCTNIAALVTATADAPASAVADTDATANTDADTAAAPVSAAKTQETGAEVRSAPGEPAMPAVTNAASTPTAPAQQSATELSASALLWRVLLSWIKSKFKKGNRTNE